MQTRVAGFNVTDSTFVNAPPHPSQKAHARKLHGESMIFTRPRENLFFGGTPRNGSHLPSKNSPCVRRFLSRQDFIYSIRPCDQQLMPCAFLTRLQKPPNAPGRCETLPRDFLPFTAVNSPRNRLNLMH